jgi:hypothetical protein
VCAYGPLFPYSSNLFAGWESSDMYGASWVHSQPPCAGKNTMVQYVWQVWELLYTQQLPAGATGQVAGATAQYQCV